MAKTPSGKGRSCVFDLEGNGLLPELTRLHCCVAIDVETKEVFDWRPTEIKGALEFLSECKMLIGHHIIGYDLRAIQKLYHPDADENWWEGIEIRDTLVMAKMVWPSDILLGRDLARARGGRMDMRMVKSHSLKAWGQRLGNKKADYDGGWDIWSEDMHAYMIQDGHVNIDLYELILKRIGWADPAPNTYVWPALPFDTEHAVAEIIAEQSENGFPFDREAAIRLAQDITNAKADVEERLIEAFGSWWQPLDDPVKGACPKVSRKVKMRGHPDIVRPRYSKTGKMLKPYVGPPVEEYDVEAPYVRIRRVTFSPSSRDHLGQRLQADYGWKPKSFGSNGKPTVDEGTLKEIPEDILPKALRQLLLDFFVLNKTLGQLCQGRKSWMAYLGEDGCIHGSIDTVGAITSRATHRNPNLSQVPAVSKGKDKKIKYGLKGGFGFECRSLFTASPGNELTGTDAASLELVSLGHYLAPYDGGEFLKRVSDPNRDAHEEHSAITGETRDDTKTVTYAYIYGAGAVKVGSGLSLEDDEIAELLEYKPLQRILDWMAKTRPEEWTDPDDMMKARAAKGHRVIKAFENGIPGIKDLKKDVMQKAAARKYLIGIDGRKLYVRKAHAALNTLLQGAGAQLCKLWMVLIHKRLKELRHAQA